LSGTEKCLLVVFIGIFITLHVNFYSFRVFGLLSEYRSLSQELAVGTIFASGALGALLASFIIMPAYDDEELQK